MTILDKVKELLVYYPNIEIEHEIGRIDNKLITTKTILSNKNPIFRIANTVFESDNIEYSIFRVERHYAEHVEVDVIPHSSYSETEPLEEYLQCVNVFEFLKRGPI